MSSWDVVGPARNIFIYAKKGPRRKGGARATASDPGGRARALSPGSLSVRVSPVSAAAFSWACWAGAVFLYSFKAQTLTSQADHKVVTQSRTQAHDSRQQLFHHLPQ